MGYLTDPVQLRGLMCYEPNYFTLPYVTCGMILMHGDRVAGTKLTWT